MVNNHDDAMQIQHIPMSDIYSDAVFNIRGEINPSTVVDLARNINANGLVQPIAVQPYKKEAGYKYRVVAGHRRFAAFQYLHRDTIPAIVKDGLTDLDALTFNFVENVNRQELNMMQEAEGIRRFTKFGSTIEEISKAIGKGKNWVRIRQALLSMPEPIQEDAAAGFLTQGQISDLSQINDPKQQMETVRLIKEAKIRGEKRLPPIREKKKNPTVMKRRNPEEIFEMIEHIIDEMGQTIIATRALAWANGEITDLDLYRDLKAYAREHELNYSPPLEVQHLMPLKRK